MEGPVRIKTMDLFAPVLLVGWVPLVKVTFNVSHADVKAKVKGHTFVESQTFRVNRLTMCEISLPTLIGPNMSDKAHN
jgi:hypothetical protein